MDPLDIKIIRKLRAGGRSEFDPFPTDVNSLREVAKELGIDKESVRNRIAKLEKKGIFLGWSAMINPNALSLKAERVWLSFAKEEAKEKATSELSKIRNIRTITIYFEKTISFVFAQNNLQVLESYLQKLKEQVEDFDKVRENVISFPECAKQISVNDRKIYETVRDSFQRSHFDISREAGISLRTVKRRLGNLTEENAFLILSSWNPSKIEGVPLELYVSCSTFKALKQFISKMASQFDDSLLAIEQYEDPSSSFAFVTKNISEASDCLEFAKSQTEPINVELHLIKKVLRVRE